MSYSTRDLHDFIHPQSEEDPRTQHLFWVSHFLHLSIQYSSQQLSLCSTPQGPLS